MIGVDSSACIDFFKGNSDPLLDALSRLLSAASSPLAVAELYRNLHQSVNNIASGIDVLQGSYCIDHGHSLLHRDSALPLICALKSMVNWRH